MPVAARLCDESAVLKVWHRGSYGRLERTNCIAIQTELRDRVDRRLPIPLAHLSCIVSAITIPQWNQVLLTGVVILSQTNRYIWAGDIRAWSWRRRLRELLK